MRLGQARSKGPEGACSTCRRRQPARHRSVFPGRASGPGPSGFSLRAGLPAGRAGSSPGRAGSAAWSHFQGRTHAAPPPGREAQGTARGPGGGGGTDRGGGQGGAGFAPSRPPAPPRARRLPAAAAAERGGPSRHPRVLRRLPGEVSPGRSGRGIAGSGRRRTGCAWGCRGAVMGGSGGTHPSGSQRCSGRFAPARSSLRPRVSCPQPEPSAGPGSPGSRVKQRSREVAGAARRSRSPGCSARCCRPLRWDRAPAAIQCRPLEPGCGITSTAAPLGVYSYSHIYTAVKEIFGVISVLVAVLNHVQLQRR